jgi:hypothetical protein
VLIREARWLGEQLQALDPREVYPLLNIGSSTHAFRTERQPWIDRHLFARARAAGHKVTHVDLKHADGVDVVADLEGRGAGEMLAREGCRGVLCTNMLEHVRDIDATCATLWSIVPPGGTLILSGPHRYPRHDDPIDNGFRPTPDELAIRFPDAQVIAGSVIKDHTFLRYMTLSFGRFFDEFPRLFTPFRNFPKWKESMRRWGYLHRRFAATGLVLRKRGP